MVKDTKRLREGQMMWVTLMDRVYEEYNLQKLPLHFQYQQYSY